MSKKLLFILIVCVLIGFFIFKSNDKPIIHSFDDCVRESGIIMESYPRQCKSFDGKIYVEEIKNINEEPTIKINEIVNGTVINSPLIIRGSARGKWFFEASFPVKLVDKQNNLIASGIAMATGDSLTDDFVPFECRLDFSISEKTEGVLVFKNDNPSGIPENDIYYRIPVIINVNGNATKIKVYFANDNLDKDVTCEKVFYTERNITNTKTIATAAIEELLKGVTEKEAKEGYRTLINSGVRLNKLVIQDGVAKIDFSEQLGTGVGGSCRVSFIRKQIEETLKQFSTVKNVIISINGDSEYILQP
ncbi:GerMN domain-containing protein [bacterium]|nr:GerMN domain-containing protein [bacterium]